MTYDIYETSQDTPEEPVDPNKVRLALTFLFNSDGTLDFEDSTWTIDFNGQNGRIEFIDENNNTVAYIPSGTDGDITGGSSSDTRVDVADDGTTQVTDTEEIDFGTNVSVTDNGDGTVTVDATDTDTHTSVSDDGTQTVSDTSDINFRKLITVTDDGDGSVTVDGSHVEIQDAGTTIAADAAQVNATTHLSATDDGSGGADIAVDLPAVVVDHPERPPIAELNDTQSIEIPVRVPDGSTLEVYRWGAFDASDGTAPTGLTAELLDGGDTVQASENTANTQNRSSPIASHSNSSGSASIFKLRAYNGTGNAINSPGVGSVFGFRVV